MKHRRNRARQAQINGSRSLGPVTIQGKAASSLNAVSHGLATEKPLILQDESAAAYHELRRGYHDKFQPADPVESDLVDLMVHSIWQLRRCQSAETALLDLEIDRLLPETRKTCPTIDPAGMLALAIKSLADNSRSLDLLRRYQAAHERTFRRTLDTLLKLRAGTAPEPEIEPQIALQPPADQGITENCGTNPASPSEIAGKAPQPRLLTPENSAMTENRPPFRLLSFPAAPAVSENAQTSPVPDPKTDPKSERQ